MSRLHMKTDSKAAGRLSLVLTLQTRHKYIDSKKDIQKVLNLLLIACLHDSVVGGNVPLLPPSLGSDLVDSRTVTQISKQKI